MFRQTINAKLRNFINLLYIVCHSRVSNKMTQNSEIRYRQCINNWSIDDNFIFAPV